MKLFILAIFSALALSGCSDDTPDGSPPDAPSGGDIAQVYALGSDATTTGILSAVAIPSLSVNNNILAGVAAGDSIVRAADGILYIINRFGSDNITIVDPQGPVLIDQISTGAGTNPQDIAVVGRTLYVCAFNSGAIITLDLDNPSDPPGSIDISSYDTDMNPNCNSIAVAGNQVIATLGLLDAEFTSQGGVAIVIDPTDNSITTSFGLTYKNPLGLIATTDPAGPLGGDLLVATTEDFGAGNGCVERITPGETPGSAGCLIENAALGGYASVIQSQGDRVWLAVSTSFTTGKLVSVDAGGVLDDNSVTAADHHVTDFVICPSGHIVTNDRTPGALRVFTGDGAEITTAPLDIGLPPVYTNGLICW